jgi:hypothetical protein
MEVMEEEDVVAAAKAATATESVNSLIIGEIILFIFPF